MRSSQIVYIWSNYITFTYTDNFARRKYFELYIDWLQLYCLAKACLIIRFASSNLEQI